MSFSESVKEILDDVDITIIIIFWFLQFLLFSAHAFVYTLWGVSLSHCHRLLYLISVILISTLQHRADMWLSLMFIIIFSLERGKQIKCLEWFLRFYLILFKVRFPVCASNFDFVLSMAEHFI